MEGEIEDASRVVDVANMIQSHEKEIAAASAQVADQEKRKKALTERVEKVFQDVDKLNVDFMALQYVHLSSVLVCIVCLAFLFTCRQKAEENASQFTSNTHALGQLSSQSGELQQRIHVVQTKVADKQLEVDEASKSVLVTKEQIQAAEAEVKASTEYDEQMQQFEAELQARVAEIREIVRMTLMGYADVQRVFTYVDTLQLCATRSTKAQLPPVWKKWKPSIKVQPPIVPSRSCVTKPLSCRVKLQSKHSPMSPSRNQLAYRHPATEPSRRSKTLKTAPQAV